MGSFCGASNQLLFRAQALLVNYLVAGESFVALMAFSREGVAEGRLINKPEYIAFIAVYFFLFGHTFYVYQCSSIVNYVWRKKPFNNANGSASCLL